jgi:hypothetical protein
MVARASNRSLVVATSTISSNPGSFMDIRYPCPCCAFLTLSSPPPGSYGLCPVCYWEDDPIQFDNPDLAGGANLESLRQAQSNMREFGASSRNSLRSVRPPHPEEIAPQDGRNGG